MTKLGPSNEQIGQFYDTHAIQVQGKVGINIRHRSIMRRLCRAGLRVDYHVFEVGCGIGTLTELMAKHVQKGTILAVDISEEAIKMAQQRFKNNGRITCEVNDMSNFSSHRNFDCIILPDVLEHIPVEVHEDLFRALGSCLSDKGVICIHIPDPFSLDRIRTERPDALQIIDQSLSIADIVARMERCGLLLERFERYGLWTLQPDYNWIEFRHPQVLTTPTRWSYLRSVWNEIRSRLVLN